MPIAGAPWKDEVKELTPIEFVLGVCDVPDDRDDPDPRAPVGPGSARSPPDQQSASGPKM